MEKRIKLILGLIWTIILRYQINKVEYTTPTDAQATPGARRMYHINFILYYILIVITCLVLLHYSRTKPGFIAMGQFSCS